MTTVNVVAMRHVVADRASGGGPEQGMVSGEVTRDAADYRALNAAGVGHAGATQQE
jgi:hypothetical protein